MEDLPYLVSLHRVSGLGSIRLQKLLQKFQTAHNIWLAEPKQLGLTDQILDNLAQIKKSTDPPKYFDQIVQSGISVLTISDPDYPSKLKEIYDPPLIIYYQGQFASADNQAIAIVGSRKVSGYGKQVTQKFTKELVQYGLTIVSGLAQGVDTVAHQTTLETKSRTIAVLGGGINQIFPPQNKELAKKIIHENGVVMSEYPPDYLHLAGNFPARNRIVAGLSLAVLVTEAAAISGSLITARLAAEQGKDVFAVPGQINSYLSEGTNNLIKTGACCTTGVDDIVQNLNLTKLTPSSTTPTLDLSLLELKILGLLSGESMHIDQIIQEIKEDPAKVSAALIKMELGGLVTNLGTGIYIKSV